MSLVQRCPLVVTSGIAKTVHVFLNLEGYYDTMDAGFLDEDGFLYIMSRSDDVINVAGHRLSAGALEEVSGPALKTRMETVILTCGFVVCSRCCSILQWETVPWWVWRTL